MRARAFSGHPFTQLKTAEDPVGVLLLIRQTWRTMEILATQLREAGDQHHHHRNDDDEEAWPVKKCGFQCGQ